MSDAPALVPIPLSGPLDTLSDEYALQVPFLAIAENLDFGRGAKSVRNRLGRRALSEFTFPEDAAQGGAGCLVWQVGSSLWKSDAGDAAVYDPVSAVWRYQVEEIDTGFPTDPEPVLGKNLQFSTPRVNKAPNFVGEASTTYGACAQNGIYRLWVFKADSRVPFAIETMDGTVIRRGFLAATMSITGAKHSALPISFGDGRSLGVVIAADNGGGDGVILYIRIDPETGAMTETELDSTDVSDTEGAAGRIPLDVALVRGTNHAVAAYKGATDAVRWVLFEETGVIVAGPTAETASGAVETVGVGCHASDGRFCVAWATDGATDSVQARAYAADGTALYAVRNIFANDPPTPVGWVSVACAMDGDVLTVCWSPWYLSDDTRSYTATVTLAGTVGGQRQLPWDSHVISDLDPERMTFWMDCPPRGLVGAWQMFMLDLETLKPVARVLVDRSFTALGFLNIRPRRDGSGMAMLVDGEGIASDVGLSRNAVLVEMDESGASSDVTPDQRFGHATTVGGGLVLGVDGAHVVEQGFLQIPGAPECDGAADSGSVAPGTYGVITTYSTVDDFGDVTESTYLAVTTVVVGGGEDTINSILETLQFTRRGRAVSQKVYRSINGQAATGPYYEVSGVENAGVANGYIPNDPSARTFFFQDKLSDAQILLRPPYRDPTGTIDPVAPLSASVCCYAKGRQWLGGGGDIPEVVQYSYLLAPYRTPEHSETNRIYALDAVTGLARLGDNMVIFTDHTIEQVPGDGPDAAGNGAFPLPQAISTDAGCVSSRAFVETPLGVIFQSRKGIMLFDGALKEIGHPVDLYGRDEIFSSCVVPELGQVRFVQAERTLCYDYTVDRWSVHTVGGGHSVMWGQEHAIIASDGRVLVETPGLYTDAGTPYLMRLLTGWIRGAGPESWMRLGRAIIRGRWRSPNTIRFAVGFSGETSFDESKWTQHLDDTIPATLDGDETIEDEHAAALSYGNDPTYGGRPLTPTESIMALVPYGNVPGSMARASRRLRKRCSGFRFLIEVNVSDAEVPGGGQPAAWISATERGRMVELYDVTCEVSVLPGMAKLRRGRNI